jgi:hypothetical protein
MILEVSRPGLHALHSIGGKVQTRPVIPALERASYSLLARGFGKFSGFAVAQEVLITGRL